MQTLKINVKEAQQVVDINDYEDAGFLSETEDECISKNYESIKLSMQRTTSKCYDDSEVIASPAPQLMRSPSKFFKKGNKLVSKNFEPARKYSQEAEACFKNQIVIEDTLSQEAETEATKANRIGNEDAQSQNSVSFWSHCAPSIATSKSFLKNSDNQKSEEKPQEQDSEERLLTTEERESFFAPLPAYTITEFVPTHIAPQPVFRLTQDLLEMCENVHQTEFPAFKQKEKTELCKFWLESQSCKYGDACAFAHGEEQLQKKTHVASKFRMTLCTSYMNAPHSCIYGKRCQFCHISTDFSDFAEQRTPYQNLLNENAKIMKSRIDQVANPDVDTFNIAMPNKTRLPIFDSICSQKATTRGKRGGKKVAQKKLRNMQLQYQIAQ